MDTPLRTQFINHLTLQRRSPKTKEAYIGAVYGLAKYYMISPDKLSDNQIQDYLRYLIEKRKLAWSTCNVVFSGLICFYKNVLNRNKTVFSIPPRARSKKIPMVLSVEEVGHLLNSVSNLKHRALLMITYSAGLRVNEVVSLKLHHIESDSSRMMIRIENGKGQKDRYTILSTKVLKVLKEYWEEYRPKEWLFFGSNINKPMPVGTAQKIYYNAKKKAGNTKGRGIHTLRHCFASHMLWNGEDIYTIKRFLGHSSIKTTYKYLHVTRQQIAAVVSPLDMLQESSDANKN